MGTLTGNSERLIEQVEQQRNASDLFRAAQVAVSEVLAAYREIAYEQTGVRAVRLSDRMLSEIRKDPTVPDDKSLWMLSVGNALKKVDGECRTPAASLILGAREIRDRADNLPADWKAIARTMGLSVARAQEIHERAVWHLRLRLEPLGPIPLHWKGARDYDYDFEQVM